MNDTQEIFFQNEDLSAHINPSGTVTTEIDFDKVLEEKEYFFNDCKFKHKSANSFIGDMEESTEINSILTPLDLSLGILKRSASSEENTETGEILEILRKKSSPTIIPNSNFSRVFSNSSPQFYDYKKRIPMIGRVIGCPQGEEVSSPVVVSPFSLPVYSPVPVRPKCVPRNSITDGQRDRFFSKKESSDDLLKSKCENKFDL